jgi:PKD repeat protein
LIDPVQFLDATNTNGESIVVDGIWDFGDNTFVRAMNPTKKYALSGTYPIWYRPITNYGCIGDTTIKKSISSKSTFSFSFSPFSINPINDVCGNIVLF